MIDITQLLTHYPSELHAFRRHILREYLQYKILELIYSIPVGEKLAFIGGTSLRLLHGGTRFSEDLDFDCKGLEYHEFETLIQHVNTMLTRNGYSVETRLVHKNSFRCYLRFSDLLLKQGVSSNSQEKLMIQIDAQAQHYEYELQQPILSKFDVLTRINTVSDSLLLSQKLYAALNRSRPMGRDFWDLMFLWPKTVPDYDYLKLKLNIATAIQLQERLLTHWNSLDIDVLKNDLRPFLFNNKDATKLELFEGFVTQYCSD